MRRPISAWEYIADTSELILRAELPKGGQERKETCRNSLPCWDAADSEKIGSPALNGREARKNREGGGAEVTPLSSVYH